MLGQCYDDLSKCPPPCESEIYCHGDLLHTIQMAHMYSDSKTFVDMKLKKPPNETLTVFRDRFKNLTLVATEDLQTFIKEYFEEPGQEFEDWQLPDWKTNPKLLQTIRDPEYRQWASQLNILWTKLGRKMTNDVKDNPDLYSIIYVPNPVIVPGGRFREFYYWDSYWIIKGLLFSEMYDTVKGMLINFLTIVKKYGFMPNGGRIYYTRRSQPPLLIPMIQAYYEVTHNFEFIKNNIEIMETEFNFWHNNNTVNVTIDGKGYQLFLYKECSSGPRPESYREDFQNAQFFKTDQEKLQFYAEIKASAESGWDFSSRWFINSIGDRKGNLTDLRIRSIVPVDLNAFMYWNAILLGDFQKHLNNLNSAKHYYNLAKKIKDAVKNVLWDDQRGIWLDYDMINKRRRDYFYPSNLSPMWTGCYDKLRHTIDKVLTYLCHRGNKLMRMEQCELKNYLGGIPTSLYSSGEQWDYPNAWPPLQHIIIMALNNSRNPDAQKLAFNLSDMWIRSNFIAFNRTSSMFEKYDSSIIGAYGGGGEYNVQLGFGWTNGVILDLLAKYGDKLSVKPIEAVQEEIKGEIQDNIIYFKSLPCVPNGGEVRTFITALYAITISLAAGIIV